MHSLVAFESLNFEYRPDLVCFQAFLALLDESICQVDMGISLASVIYYLI